MTLAPDDRDPLWPSARLDALRERDIFDGLTLLMEQVVTAHADADKALANYVFAAKDRDMARAKLALERAARNLQTAQVLACSAANRIGREQRREPRIRT